MTEVFSVLTLLEEKGWLITPLLDGWQLRHSSLETVVYMSITPQKWLCLTIPLIDDNSFSLSLLGFSDTVDLYRWLLEQNDVLFMAKFGLDQHDTVVLMAEVMLDESHAQLAIWAADAIIQYKKALMRLVRQMTSQTSLSIDEGMKPPQETFSRSLAVEKPKSVSHASSRAYQGAEAIAGLDAEMIRRFMQGMKAYKWRIKDKMQASTAIPVPVWVLGYTGSFREFTVYATTSKNWTYFYAFMLPDSMASSLHLSLSSPDTQQHQVLFFKYMLCLSHIWFMAKAGLSHDNRPLLLLEVPTVALDFSLFRHTLRTMATYLDRFDQEMQLMAALQRDYRLFELLHTSTY